MKYILFFSLMLVLGSCGAVKVNYDYDANTDFTAYTTYSYFDDMVTGLSQLDERRLMVSIDKTMQEKGYLFTEEADLLINIQSAVSQNGNGSNVGVGVGGGGIGLGGGLSVGIPVGGPKLRRTITIDLVDAKKDVLIWQANSESPFKEGDAPAVKEEKMNVLTAKIFEKYPPKRK